MRQHGRPATRVSNRVFFMPSQHSLRCIPLFAHVDADELEAIEVQCRWQSYAQGEEILAYRASDDDVYFMIAGEAKVVIYSTQGRLVDFRELVAGDVFGEYAAIDGGSRSASIEAQTDCLVAGISSDDFQHLIRHNSSVSYALVLHLTRQLRDLTRRVYEFSTLAVNNRIQGELLRLARENLQEGSTVDGSPLISPTPTHAAIAARVSTHREAVSRQMSSLTRLGVVEKQGRSLIVRDIERLERLVRDATGE